MQRHSSLTTVRGALARGKSLLHDENQREIEWLLCDILGWTQIQLITHSEYCLTTDQQIRYETLLSRRLQGEPLAYLLGQWEFWSLKLIIGPAVLIPRPETELLVELALTYLHRILARNMKFVYIESSVISSGTRHISTARLITRSPK